MCLEEMDVVAIGESLVDCLIHQEGNKVIAEGSPGGAPSNVLAALSRLGKKTAFIGKVGNDFFGRFLKEMMEQSGISTSGVVFCDKPTTLAVVSLTEKGDRSFRFYRSNTADVDLEEADVCHSLIDACKIFHFGTVSMSEEKSQKATKHAVLYARSVGKKISFDPNLRPALWEDTEKARDAMLWGLQNADYVKLSEEEQEFLTGISDPIEGGLHLLKTYPVAFLAVTMGPKGLACFCNGMYRFGYSYNVETKDTTGAGDAMWGATLSWLLDHSGKQICLNEQELERLVEYANAAGSCCTTKYGAIPAMPSERDILDCMERVDKLIW